MPRRTFLVGSFAITAAAMLALLVLDDPGKLTIIAAVRRVRVRALRARRTSVTSTCRSCSPPTCAPPASAWRLRPAASVRRPARSCCRSWWPRMGVRTALGACFVVLASGGLVCYALAPETRNSRSIRLPDDDGQEEHGQAWAPAVSPVFPDGVFRRARTAALRQSPARPRVLPMGDPVAGRRRRRREQRHPDRGAGGLRRRRRHRPAARVHRTGPAAGQGPIRDCAGDCENSRAAVARWAE